MTEVAIPEPHEVIKDIYSSMDVYYTELLTTHKLAELLKNIISRKSRNWIVIGATWCEPTNSACEFIHTCACNTATRINLNRKESNKVADEEIKKLNDAIFEAIPNIKRVNNNFTRKVTALKRNIWGSTCEIPIVIMTDDGHIHDGVIFK